MKRVVAIILLLVLVAISVSCEKETLLTVDQTSISFTDAGGSQTVTLTANKPWSVSSTQSWCKVSPTGGEEATSSRITITCDANTTYDARTCTVTFTCAEMTKSVTVSQATNNGLQVSQTTYEVTKAAQQLNIEVKANVKFSVEVDNGCKDWVKYNTTKALTTSTVVLDIAENKTYDSREGKVTIKQDGGSLSSTITIKQSQLDGLFLTTSEYNLSNEKHTLTVEVSTNVEFDVKPEADWVKYIQTKGLSTKQIVLEVAENDTYDQRETKVNVKQKNGDLSGTINIKQDEKYGILVSQSEYNLTNEAQTIEVEVKYNVDFEVSIPDGCKDWISIMGTKGLSSRNYTVAITKNETYDNREGSITFKQKNGSLSGTVKINQSQTDGLIAEKTEYIISYEEQQLNIKVASNIEYEVYIDEDCRSWLSRVQTKGLTEETITFQVTKNEGDERIGKITFKSSTLQETVLIRQRVEGNVVFEDANFKAYCVTNFDKNGDGEISMAEAKDIIVIDIDTYNVSSLQGIENMPNLRRLFCHGKSDKGKLTSLDVSHNMELRIIVCYDNRLTSLDVSNNIYLARLECQDNQLTSLDVSNNTALEDLDCYGNQLTSLDVSNNTGLVTLYCYSNQLTSLDFSKNTALWWVQCYNNQLTSLDVSNNTALEELNCYGNQLTRLDVSQNTALLSLNCDNNQLTSLDVSNNMGLEVLDCGGNQLTSLDVSKNTSLRFLNCDNNQLTSLNTNQNTALTIFSCGWNRLTSLDVTKNTVLNELYCAHNQLTSLDVSNNSMLSTLYCYANPYLTEIWLKMNQTIPNFQYDTDVATIKYK